MAKLTKVKKCQSRSPMSRLKMSTKNESLRHDIKNFFYIRRRRMAATPRAKKARRNSLQKPSVVTLSMDPGPLTTLPKRIKLPLHQAEEESGKHWKSEEQSEEGIGAHGGHGGNGGHGGPGGHGGHGGHGPEGAGEPHSEEYSDYVSLNLTFQSALFVLFGTGNE